MYSYNLGLNSSLFFINCFAVHPICSVYALTHPLNVLYLKKEYDSLKLHMYTDKQLKEEYHLLVSWRKLVLVSHICHQDMRPLVAQESNCDQTQRSLTTSCRKPMLCSLLPVMTTCDYQCRHCTTHLLCLRLKI